MRYLTDREISPSFRVSFLPFKFALKRRVLTGNRDSDDPGHIADNGYEEDRYDAGSPAIDSPDLPCRITHKDLRRLRSYMPET